MPERSKPFEPEPGFYQPEGKEGLQSDRAVFELLIKKARDAENLEEKNNRRDSVKKLISHGLMDRQYLLELLRSQNADKNTIKKWETSHLTITEILDDLIPLPVEKTEKNPKVIEIDSVILTTDEEPILGPGEKRGWERGTVPRNNLLIKMLDENGIKPDEYTIVSGKKQPNTVRKEDYRLFLLTSLGKMVFVCDETDNSTFVIHQLIDNLDNIKELCSLRKTELAAMGELVNKINWTDKQKWQEQMMDSITKQTPNGKRISNWPEFIQSIREKAQDKKEKQVFVDLSTLKTQVHEAGVKGIKQYHTARKNHPNWPSVPHDHYGNKWVDWYDLLGKEKPNFVSLDTLKTQVQEAGVKGIRQYHTARKKHLGWISNPDVFYGDEWVDWYDLFGKEKKEKPNLIDLNTLKAQVLAFGVKSQSQYRKAQINHPNWPSNPYDHYGNKWVDWYDLFGKERPPKNGE